jgi:hypothetical protein
MRVVDACRGVVNLDADSPIRASFARRRRAGGEMAQKKQRSTFEKFRCEQALEENDYNNKNARRPPARQKQATPDTQAEPKSRPNHRSNTQRRNGPNPLTHSQTSGSQAMTRLPGRYAASILARGDHAFRPAVVKAIERWVEDDARGGAAAVPEGVRRNHELRSLERVR